MIRIIDTLTGKRYLSTSRCLVPGQHIEVPGGMRTVNGYSFGSVADDGVWCVVTLGTSMYVPPVPPEFVRLTEEMEEVPVG